MRKIKRPNIIVKPREIFYRLKRAKQLENLEEASIEEILKAVNPASFIDPGCLYENFYASEIRGALLPLASNKEAMATIAIATLGDFGLEAFLKKVSDASSGDESLKNKSKIVLAWAGAMLDKLAGFAGNLIEEEAKAENLELGSVMVFSPDKEPALWEFIASRLVPNEKLNVQMISDPLDGTKKIIPAFTKVWLVPWLTKKEKKQLISSAAG